MTASFREQPLEIRKILVKEMVLRMAATYGIKKSALHNYLGCTKGLVSNWIYHGRIPYEYLEACSVTKGVSMDWLLYGTASAQMLNNQDIQMLTTMHKNLLHDGVEYGLIVPHHSGVLNQLANKFSNDLKRWTGIEQTAKRNKGS
jgi:hypothetical protein